MAAEGSQQTAAIAYSTSRGKMFHGRAEVILEDQDIMSEYRGATQLVFTSPPFPLNHKKKYGNLTGRQYVDWLASLAPRFRDLLTENGSIVIELGNAWEPGDPVMSTLTLRALFAFLEEGRFYLCQEFICHNPARLPNPVQWVNIERIRVKDSFTHVWWMSPVKRPKADNRRVLTAYSESMQKLLQTRKYNAGKRPSGYNIGQESFFRNNDGAIPPSVLTFANTSATDDYQRYVRAYGWAKHPARMAPGLAEFFVKFLTDEHDMVLDPFGGTNTTGGVAERLARRWASFEPRFEYIASSRVRFPLVCEHVPFENPILPLPPSSRRPRTRNEPGQTDLLGDQ